MRLPEVKTVLFPIWLTSLQTDSLLSCDSLLRAAALPTELEGEIVSLNVV